MKSKSTISNTAQLGVATFTAIFSCVVAIISLKGFSSEITGLVVSPTSPPTVTLTSLPSRTPTPTGLPIHFSTEEYSLPWENENLIIITVIVLDKNNDPIRGAEVSLITSRESIQKITDEDGFTNFILRKNSLAIINVHATRYIDFDDTLKTSESQVVVIHLAK